MHPEVKVKEYSAGEGIGEGSGKPGNAREDSHSGDPSTQLEAVFASFFAPRPKAAGLLTS